MAKKRAKAKKKTARRLTTKAAKNYFRARVTHDLGGVDVGVPASSPLAVGAGQTGETVTVIAETAPSVLFRPHRYGMTLETSMSLAAEQQPLTSRADLVALLADAEPGAELLDIVPYGLDARNGWYHHTVRVTRADGAKAIVGFTNGPLD